MKIFAIGNSFSEDGMEYLYPILQDLGEENIVLKNLAYPGCTVDQHVEFLSEDKPVYYYREYINGAWVVRENQTGLDKFCSDEWDVVTTQQASWLSGKSSTYDKVPDLLAIIQKNAKKTPKIKWHMTWAYEGDSVRLTDHDYDGSQLVMYRGILDAVQQKVLPIGVYDGVIPSGTAVQNARTSYVGDTLTRDKTHLSIPLGRYIAALTWAGVLTGKSLQNVRFAPEGVDEQMKAVAIEAAENALRSPFEITQSIYK